MALAKSRFSIEATNHPSSRFCYEASRGGHSVYGLLERLPPSCLPEPELKAAAKELDKHYIPARYPNSYSEGAPFEYYTAGEAERAIEHAKRIIRFCEDHLV